MKGEGGTSVDVGVGGEGGEAAGLATAENVLGLPLIVGALQIGDHGLLHQRQEDERRARECPLNISPYWSLVGQE